MLGAGGSVIRCSFPPRTHSRSPPLCCCWSRGVFRPLRAPFHDLHRGPCLCGLLSELASPHVSCPLQGQHPFPHPGPVATFRGPLGSSRMSCAVPPSAFVSLERSDLGVCGQRRRHPRGLSGLGVQCVAQRRGLAHVRWRSSLCAGLPRNADGRRPDGLGRSRLLARPRGAFSWGRGGVQTAAGPSRAVGARRSGRRNSGAAARLGVRATRAWCRLDGSGPGLPNVISCPSSQKESDSPVQAPRAR